jgi:hypothetical protein
VRRLPTRIGTWDIQREKKQSETEELVRRVGTSYRTRDIMRDESKRNRGACEEAGDEKRRQTREFGKRN